MPKRKSSMISGIFYYDIQFFRFYKDGIVLDCLIKGNDQPIRKEQIQGWFRRDKLSKGILQSNYILKGKRIEFSTTGHFGNGRLIEYQGWHEKDRLILSSLNHNTGRRTDNQIYMRLI